MSARDSFTSSEPGALFGPYRRPRGVRWIIEAARAFVCFGSFAVVGVILAWRG